jgi:hypothetical protein
MGHRSKKLVYHLTALDNLHSIRAHGLLSRREIRTRGIRFENVADAGILEEREAHGLDEMVPFHFMPRNPFDYRVVRDHPERQFILLSVRRTYALEQDWSVIPRHPLTAAEPPRILAWPQGMDEIDWSQMDRDDRDWEIDHHCKMTCMAEALSPRTVALGALFAIYVATEATRAVVAELVAGVPGLHVDLNAGMFPRGCR